MMVGDKIVRFDGRHSFLSNFFEVPINAFGYTFKCVESAFQSQKDVSVAHEFLPLDGNESKKKGRRVKLSKTWENDKKKIMYFLVKEKFYQNENLAQLLLETGDCDIIEGNNWHDNYWGNCICEKCINIVGENHLGRILKQVRASLKMKSIIPIDEKIILVIAGGRDFDDYDKLKENVIPLLKGRKRKNIEIVSGGAKGADSLGERFAKEFNIKLKRFIPDWDGLGKYAGIARNKEMCDYANAVICFFDGSSSGTKHMVEYSRKNKKLISVVKYEKEE